MDISYSLPHSHSLKLVKLGLEPRYSGFRVPGLNHNTLSAHRKKEKNSGERDMTFSLN